MDALQRVTDTVVYARIAEPGETVPKTLEACTERYLGIKSGKVSRLMKGAGSWLGGRSWTRVNVSGVTIGPIATGKLAGKFASARIVIEGNVDTSRKIEFQRFKGLGEMMAMQLKETTMDRKKRTLLRVMLADKDKAKTAKSVEVALRRPRLETIAELEAELAIHLRAAELIGKVVPPKDAPRPWR